MKSEVFVRREGESVESSIARVVTGIGEEGAGCRAGETGKGKAIEQQVTLLSSDKCVSLVMGH